MAEILHVQLASRLGIRHHPFLSILGCLRSNAKNSMGRIDIGGFKRTELFASEAGIVSQGEHHAVAPALGAGRGKNGPPLLVVRNPRQLAKSRHQGASPPESTWRVAILETSAPFELAQNEPINLGMMYPVYLRGESYLQAQQGKQAAEEFQKIIDHRGIVLNFPLGALARLGLARAYALLGDTAKARAAYKDFLDLWKGADSDVPILKEAKTEYAQLR